MELATGKILEGKVTGVMPFGAFVTLADGKTTGLVHISEISNDYIEDINDHIKNGDEVTVMVLNCDNIKKISLSIKRAQRELAKNAPKPAKTRPAVIEWGSSSSDTSSLSFEDKMAKFKLDSEDKMSHYAKRSNESRSRGRKFGKQ